MQPFCFLFVRMFVFVCSSEMNTCGLIYHKMMKTMMMMMMNDVT